MIVPVILSGGSGTRLWPLSRKLRPKQFIDIHGADSMFSQTLARVDGDPFAPPLIICNHEHRFLVAEELRTHDVVAATILLEPLGRNTAPAIAVAAHQLAKTDPEALMLVLSSDHVIEDAASFRETVMAASELASQDHLVTFGVQPDRPETGYGYIRRGDSLNPVGFRVDRFVEKPDQAKAEEYLRHGDYYWNAGIFLFSAQALLDEIEKFSPEVTTAALAGLSASEQDLDFTRLDEKAFAAAPAISIDYAVMEKTNRAAVVPLQTKWSDVGSWASLWELSDADADGNVADGPALVLDSRNTFIRSQKPLVAAMGVENLVIVATDDVVLVLPKDRTQEVKDIFAHLDQLGFEETVSHTSVYRPWGHYQNLERGDRFLVKRIVVNPGAKLSLQYHHHRAEHWIVVAGTARVTNGNEILELGPNQSTYIPIGAPHRLENPGNEPLHLIEVQSGSYIGEDDIVRVEDTYGRG